MPSKLSRSSKTVVYYLLIAIIFSHTFIHDAYSMLPSASQEGPLRPFKNYKDLTMFHYSVPKEVFRATWQFAASTDRPHCPSRKVHIYLRQGSYPVVAINNATLPENVYVNDTNMIHATTMTSTGSQVSVTIPIYGPRPGDWFIGAYLSDWDEKVQQQGFSHKCRYTLASIAVWTQANGIEDIPIGSTKTLRTNEPASYYKIYVPAGTWHLRVTVSSCNFTVPVFHGRQTACIKRIALRGLSLPVSEGYFAVNLSTTSTHTFTELSPYEDRYYYLLVVSESVIKFDVKVSISECPLRSLAKSHAATYLNAAMFDESSKFGIGRFRYRRSNTLLNETEDEIIPNDDTCVPRHRLVRVQQLQHFSSVYLLQIREWFTPWITLTDFYPTILQFDILPLVDIGGTLSIDVHLEMHDMLSGQLVLVDICIRKGRVPRRIKGKIKCDDSNMLISLSSMEKNSSTILIPFPQPDTWHIAMEAKCFTKGVPESCAMEEILVSLDLKTIPCVFPGNDSCGSNGICEETQRALISYASCTCTGGYKGWGCTDASNADSKTLILATRLMLTLSNCFFLPAIYLAFKRKLYAEGLVYLSTMVFSTLYHACDQQFMTYCITRYEILQYSDFFASILAFWVTFVAMARISDKFVPLFHMTGVLIISLCVEVDRTALSSILLPVVTGSLIPIGAYIYRFWKTKRRRWPEGLGKLIVGLSLALIGILLFSLLETESNYRYVHSVWHAIIASSLLFLLPKVRLRINDSAMRSESSNLESELLNYKPICESPVFVVPMEQRGLAVREF